MLKYLIPVLSAGLVLMLSGCSGTPRLDLPMLLSQRAEPEPVPSALLQRCADALPIPAEIERDGEVSPLQLLQINASWAGEFHYCRGRMDALVDYIRSRQGKEP